MKLAAATNLYPNRITLPPGSIQFTWSANNQRFYQIRWRVKGAVSWNYISSKIESSNRYHNFSFSQKNIIIEWQVRVWTGIKGSEIQESWSELATLTLQESAIGIVKIQGSSTPKELRIVPIGKSELPSNVRINTADGVGEYDLTTINTLPDSGVHICTKTGVIRGIAKNMGAAYGDYLAYSEYSQYSQYSNYYNYSDYGDHSDYSDYSDYLDYGDYGCLYGDYSDGYGIG